MTEEQYNEDAAAEIVHIMYDPETFAFSHIGIVDTEGNVAQELDRNLAREVAYRLLRLADQAPPPQVILPSRTAPKSPLRPIRRLSVVDDHLRSLDD